VSETRIVVDTSIFFSLPLRGDTPLRKRFLTDSGPQFHCPRFVFVELFKHKERIAQATALSEVHVAAPLAEEDQIAFNTGSHTELIQLAYRDFERLAQPKVAAFTT
jgi:hypothetical protein